MPDTLPRTRVDRISASERRRLERLGDANVGDRVRHRLDPIARGHIIRAQERWNGQRSYLVTVRWDFPFGGQIETRINARLVERIDP